VLPKGGGEAICFPGEGGTIRRTCTLVESSLGREGRRKGGVKGGSFNLATGMGEKVRPLGFRRVTIFGERESALCNATN